MAPADSPKLVLITGATSGIGAAYARRLAEQGYHLWLTGRRMAILDALADELRAAYAVQVQTESVDLSQEAELDALVGRVQACKHMHGLINNAGYADDGTFHLITPQRHRAQMRVHMEATTLLAQAALPHLEVARGFLINVASLASWMPTPGSPLYGPTKAFVRLFTETLALTYHQTGIRFQALCPGFVITDFHARMGLDPDQFYHKRGPAKAFPAAWVVERSLRDLNKPTVICSPGIHYRFLAWLIRYTPRRLLYRLLKVGMKSRYG